jgi:hypothetical protein
MFPDSFGSIFQPHLAAPNLVCALQPSPRVLDGEEQRDLIRRHVKLYLDQVAGDRFLFGAFDIGREPSGFLTGGPEFACYAVAM